MIDLMLVLKSRGSMDGSSMDDGSIDNVRSIGHYSEKRRKTCRPESDRSIETFIMMSRIVVGPKQRSFGLGWWDAKDQKKQPAPDGVASSKRGLWTHWPQRPSPS